VIWKAREWGRKNRNAAMQHSSNGEMEKWRNAATTAQLVFRFGRGAGTQGV